MSSPPATATNLHHLHQVELAAGDRDPSTKVELADRDHLHRSSSPPATTTTTRSSSPPATTTTVHQVELAAPAVVVDRAEAQSHRATPNR